MSAETTPEPQNQQPGSDPAGRPAATRERRYDIIYRVGVLAVTVLCFVSMVQLAASTSLWLDEMFEVEYCRTCTLAQIVTTDPFTPPLFNIIAHTWYQLVPYGELWLRLPSIVFVTASLPLLALTGRRLGGRRCGFLAAFLLLINAKVYTQCGLTFRTYALLLFVASLYVYLYVRRVQATPGGFSWGLSIALGLAMLALGYTHYFGVLLAGLFFVVDLYLLARGRLNGVRAKVFVPYAIAVVGYLPWAYIALGTLFNVGSGLNTWAGERDQWQSTTAETNLHGLLYWLCGECAETLGLFHVAVIILVVTTVYQCVHRSFEWQQELPLIGFLVAIWGMIGIMWVYATFVNEHSMFWVERYFIPLVPCITIVSAWGVTKIFSWIPTSDPARFIAAFLCVVLLVPTASGTINNDLAEGSSTRFYHDLTQWLEDRKDIQREDTLVLAIIFTTDRGRNIAAWKHYYFDQKDTRDFQVQILDGLDPSVQLNPYDLLRYRTIYVTCQHFNPPIPDTYVEVFRRFYKKHTTKNPGGGTTVYYTRKS